jgi:hypothetical protein
MRKRERPLSRREFARSVALGTAATLLPLPNILPSSAAAAPVAAAQNSADTPNLSSQSQAEAEARYQAIVAQYPDRFSDAQKIDLKRLCIFVQPALDHIRAYTIANGDLPALYLKPLVDRDKKPVTAPAVVKAASAVSAKPATAAPGKP